MLRRAWWDPGSALKTFVPPLLLIAASTPGLLSSLLCSVHWASHLLAQPRAGLWAGLPGAERGPRGGHLGEREARSRGVLSRVRAAWGRPLSGAWGRACAVGMFSSVTGF